MSVCEKLEKWTNLMISVKAVNNQSTDFILFMNAM